MGLNVMAYFGFYFSLAGYRCVARVAALDSVCARDQLMTKFAEATEVELLESGGDEKKLKLALSKRSEIECPQQKKKSLEEAEAPQPQPSSPDPPKLQKVPVKNLWIPRL
jgi:hypothetical protein